MEYKTSHVQTLFSVSPETVRNWSEEFNAYLSVTANPGTGRHRIFTHEDLRVFAFVAELKAKGMTYADIHASLQNGQRGDVPEMAVTQLQEIQLSLQLDQAQEIVMRLQSERDAAVTQAKSLQEENIRLATRLEMIEEITNKRLEDAQRRINELSSELEKARGEVNKLTGDFSYLRGKVDASQNPNDQD